MNLQTDKDLYEFLANAPKEFTDNEKIKKFQLKNGDFIHCVLWNMHFYITGTDIVKVLVWRFQNAGRQIVSLKKFEEGVFSDLRNLKPGIDATLEGPRSDFLEFLYKNGCIRTQKKQKVFFWYSVPHDALFCDALERDLRRETNLYAYSKYYSKNNYASLPIQQDGQYESWQQPNMNHSGMQNSHIAQLQQQPIQNQHIQQMQVPSGHNQSNSHISDVSNQMPMNNMPTGQSQIQNHLGPQGMMQMHPQIYMQGPGTSNMPSQMMNFYMENEQEYGHMKDSYENQNDYKLEMDQRMFEKRKFANRHVEMNQFAPSFDTKEFEMDTKDFEKQFNVFDQNAQQYNDYYQENREIQPFELPQMQEPKNIQQQQYVPQPAKVQKNNHQEKQKPEQFENEEEDDSDHIMMPELNGDYVDPDMIIPNNKRGKSEQQ